MSISLTPAFELNLSWLWLVRAWSETWRICLNVPLKSLGKLPDLRSYSISAKSPSYSFLLELCPSPWICEIRSSEGASAALFKLFISFKLMSKFSSALIAEFWEPLRWSSFPPFKRTLAILFWRASSEMFPDGSENASERSDSGAASKWFELLFNERWF